MALNILPLILGAVVSRAADREAEDRRQRLLDAMKAYQTNKAKDSEAAIETLISKQKPDARQAELDAITASRAASLGASVDAVKSTNPAPIAGKLSPDYEKSQEQVAGTVAERTRRAIEQLSTMGAPGERDFKQGLRFGKAGTDVDAANTAIRNVGDAYMTDMNNVRASPGLKLIGGALMAYGGGGLGSTGDGTNVNGYGGAGDVSTRNRLSNAYSLWGRRR